MGKETPEYRPEMKYKNENSILIKTKTKLGSAFNSFSKWFWGEGVEKT